MPFRPHADGIAVKQITAIRKRNHPKRQRRRGRFTELRLQECSHSERRTSLTLRGSLRLRRTNRAFVMHSNRSTDTVQIEANHEMTREY